MIHALILKAIGKEPRQEVNPDLIVSMGAALQAATIAGEKGISVLVDITPYTFGTSAVGMHEGQCTHEQFVPIIRRNSPLPVRKSELFFTMDDNQDGVDVNIYQGEKPLAPDNILIGNFVISGLSRRPAGNPILLNLDLDLSGMLKVTAMEKDTGLSKTVVMNTRDIDAGKAPTQSRADILDLLNGLHPELPDEGDDGVSADSTTTRSEDPVGRAKNLRKRAEKLLATVSEEDAGELKSLLEKSRATIEAGDKTTLRGINESLSDMLFYLED